MPAEPSPQIEVKWLICGLALVSSAGGPGQSYMADNWSFFDAAGLSLRPQKIVKRSSKSSELIASKLPV